MRSVAGGAALWRVAPPSIAGGSTVLMEVWGRERMGDGDAALCEGCGNAPCGRFGEGAARSSGRRVVSAGYRRCRR